MAFRRIDDLPTAESLDQEFPIDERHAVDQHRQEISAILRGDDSRMLMITGPCSAWSPEGVYEYADRLARLQEQVQEQLKLVMRLYVQKPRTTLGWTGPLTHPDPLNGANIPGGMRLCREMMHRVGQQLPLADEMVYTHNIHDYPVGLSYIAMGARSTQDPEHRHIASGVDCPFGVKNPTSGDVRTGVESVKVVQSSHDLMLAGEHVQTDGNPDAHLILRGGVHGPNYTPQHLASAHRFMEELGIVQPAVVVDASHDNSFNGHGKDPTLQPHVVGNVLWGVLAQREEYERVRGFMMESFIHGGNQNISPEMIHGLSITDPCLDWEATEKSIREAADQLSTR